MKNLNFILLGLLLACTLIWSSCRKKEKPPIPNGPGGAGNNTNPIHISNPADWLSGDLHLHSKYSADAPTDGTVAERISLAKHLGFGFFTLTDHDNNGTGNVPGWTDPEFLSANLILLYGSEHTTGCGHANIFGTKPWDNPALYALQDNRSAVIDRAHDMGLIFSICHPYNKDCWVDPTCSQVPPDQGFDLDYDGIEVWQAVFGAPNNVTGSEFYGKAINRLAIEKWDELMLQGRKLFGRGGSDVHNIHDTALTEMGTPTNWVNTLGNKTSQGVLDGIKSGHISISYAATGEHLDFTADRDLDGKYDMIIGDNLVDHEGGLVRFKVEIVGFRPAHANSYRINVIKNGKLFIDTAHMNMETYIFEDKPVGQTFYRVELSGPTPDMPSATNALQLSLSFISMTNPIFFNYP